MIIKILYIFPIGVVLLWLYQSTDRGLKDKKLEDTKLLLYL